MISSWLWTSLLLFTGSLQLSSATSIGHSKAAFISRPDLRPPTFRVTQQQTHKATPGFWFLAPFDQFDAPHEGCHTGPHIFAEDGDLIWSGACEVGNRLSHDFKAWNCNGSSCLSYIELPKGSGGSVSRRRGVGVLLDDKYNLVAEVMPDQYSAQFNMHEFTVTRDGESFLGLVDYSRYVNNAGPRQNVKVWDGGFREADIQGRSITFQWRASDQVELSESTVEFHVEGKNNVGRDWFHLNSVDKDRNGDYLISARYTDCIYKISGLNGSVIWRLGGINSTFAMNGLNFSRQHDARFLEDFEHDSQSQQVISFLNNAAGGDKTSHDISEAYIVALDPDRGVAKVLQRFPRPDGNATTHMGNAQVLPTKNVLVSWSDQAYITEFEANGEIAVEASVEETGVRTYRAYKFNFTGYSHEPIAMKCFTYITNMKENMTTSYMSWNGATTVSRWALFNPLYNDAYGHQQQLATVKRSGFESMAVLSGKHTSLLVKALDASGAVLGSSEVQQCEVFSGGYEIPGAIRSEEEVGPSFSSHQSQSWSLRPLGQLMIGALLGFLIPRRGLSAIWQNVKGANYLQLQRETRL